jgi:hypothetical protein
MKESIMMCSDSDSSWPLSLIQLCRFLGFSMSFRSSVSSFDSAGVQPIIFDVTEFTLEVEQEITTSLVELLSY